MNYKEFINEPLSIRGRIEHQIADVNYKWDICTSITSNLHERVQTSPTNNSERSRLRYSEAKRKLDAMYDEYDRACENVRKFLYENLEPDIADLLEWRYCDGKNLKEIAKLKGMSYDSVKNKMAMAEKKAERRYNGY